MNKILTKHILLVAFAVMIGGTLDAQNASGVQVGGNVFGGGNNAKVNGNTEVTINQVSAYVTYDVYGGGALAETGTGASGGNPATTHTVTLNKGTVRDIYGGGLGQISPDNIEAHVHGTVEVIVNGGKADNVFGCNNLNGTPKSTVAVTVNGSDPTIVDGDTGAKTYAIKGVYGGGNQAHYLPTTVTKDYPIVTINGCATSIENVYGGGKAAGVSQTNVIINGGDIGRAFAGGDGDNANDTPAHVGYDNTEAAPTTSSYPDPTDENGVGDVNILVKGGTIVQVFGGSNKNGIIRDNVNIEVEKNTGTGACEMHLAEVYGGGNMAPSKAATNFNIGCTGGVGEGIDNVYGGANQADVTGDIILNIVDGRIGNVFGGNNTSGSINGSITVNINMKADPCGWYLGNVFGGGNHADYNGTPDVNIINGTVSGNVYGGGNDITTANAGVAGSDVEMTGGIVLGGIYGGCNLNGSVTGDALVKIYGGTVGSSGTRAEVFGGGLGQNTKVNGNVTVDINKGDGVAVAPSIYGDVYGGSAKGLVNCTNDGTAQNGDAKTDVTLTLGTVYGNLYGGGLGETNGAAADVWGPVTVTVSGGSVSTYNDGADGGNVYGCNNYNGAPRISTSVLIEGGTIAHDVFGGGNLANVNLATHVTVSGGTVLCDVYGGGALANTGATNVDIMGGTIGRDIYGGGLGDANHAPVENGVVTVNIGTGIPDPDNPFGVLPTEVDGDATIGGSVYGCNNTAGSPQDNVIVNIFKTAHTEGPDGNSVQGTGYAIANVFGGGNEADYTASGDVEVNVYTCDNTIRRVFGGGNAAATKGVETNIQGGRFYQVFGGGNGERGEDFGADVHGDVNLNIHGGSVGEFYGGSNQNGTISGQIIINADAAGPCSQDLNITDFFCGGNFVEILNGLTTTIGCSGGGNDVTIENLYGGCNQAKITGNVVLNVEGGTYTNVFGGSKGTADTPADIVDYPAGDPLAGTGGNVTLNLYGGTIQNAFGGCNVKGNVAGKIVVNVVDKELTCPLIITNIYGGGNLTDYTPTYTPASGTERISPVVNVVHTKYGISGNVYGGSKGEVGGGTELHANPLVNIGYDADMDDYIPESYLDDYSNLLVAPTANVAGSVFGGGDAATVNGNTEVRIRHHAVVGGNVYGGGNMGEVEGNTKVVVNSAYE